MHFCVHPEVSNVTYLCTILFTPCALYARNLWSKFDSDPLFSPPLDQIHDLPSRSVPCNSPDCSPEVPGPPQFIPLSFPLLPAVVSYSACRSVACENPYFGAGRGLKYVMIGITSQIVLVVPHNSLCNYSRMKMRSRTPL